MDDSQGIYNVAVSHSQWAMNGTRSWSQVSQFLKYLFCPVPHGLSRSKLKAKLISTRYSSCQIGTALKTWPQETAFAAMSYIGSGRKLKMCAFVPASLGNASSLVTRAICWGRFEWAHKVIPINGSIQSGRPTDAVVSLSLYKRSSILLKTNTSGKCECIFRSAGERLNWSLCVQNPGWPLKRGKGTVPPLNRFLFVEEGTWDSIRKNMRKGAGRRKHPYLGRGGGRMGRELPRRFSLGCRPLIFFLSIYLFSLKNTGKLKRERKP